MLEMSYFNTLALPVVVAACLIFGFILKKWVKDVDNKYIPTILAIAGAALACIVKGEASVEVIVAGSFSGLASTGLHQAFVQLMNNEE